MGIIPMGLMIHRKVGLLMIDFDDEGLLDDSDAEFSRRTEPDTQYDKEMAAEWEEAYGFPHHCRCRQDWDEGNIVEVSRCYFDMSIDALNHCAELKKVKD